MNRPSASSFTATMTLLARELSFAPRNSTSVTSSTIAAAGTFTRIGIPATRGADASRPCTPGSELRSAVR